MNENRAKNPILTNVSNRHIHLSKDDMETLKDMIEKKMWISNSVKGWKPEMESILREHYSL